MGYTESSAGIVPVYISMRTTPKTCSTLYTTLILNIEAFLSPLKNLRRAKQFTGVCLALSTPITVYLVYVGSVVDAYLNVLERILMLYH
ncbi:MAG: hypothetical protein FD169_1229 [Bacillota bacterium]|nr:MAG: hypothetical protein FD169_1229 [Bacillota bacterium]